MISMAGYKEKKVLELPAVLEPNTHYFLLKEDMVTSAHILTDTDGNPIEVINGEESAESNITVLANTASTKLIVPTGPNVPVCAFSIQNGDISDTPFSGELIITGTDILTGDMVRYVMRVIGNTVTNIATSDVSFVFTAGLGQSFSMPASFTEDTITVEAHADLTTVELVYTATLKITALATDV